MMGMLGVGWIVLGAWVAQTPDATYVPPTPTAHFEPGRGLAFSFEEDQHEFSIGGFIQPAWGFEEVGGTVDQFFNARRTHLMLRGAFFNRTAEVFVQADFSRDEPLLDAWLAYNPWPWLSIATGQRLAVTNNREMLHMESQLTFVDRSLLSRTFSRSGRELGVFVLSEVGLGPVLVRPQLSVTSGDGRNSFGVDSRDRDVGGLKWGGRLDVLPFGDFSQDNGGMVVDLAREQSLKLVVGGAASYNDGASQQNGAGHRDFTLYNPDGGVQQPDYVLIYADVLVKYMGFSLLLEVVNASATSLENTFTNEAATVPLFSGQISEFLVLGNAVHAQFGYVFDFGLGLDLRYTQLFAEFSDEPASLLQDGLGYGASVAWYALKQALKVQFSFEVVDIDRAGPAVRRGDVLVQLIL